MNAFRDDQLFSIFELSLDLLNKFSQNLIPVTDVSELPTLSLLRSHLFTCACIF